MTASEWIIIAIVAIAVIYIVKKLVDQLRPEKGCKAGCGCEADVRAKSRS